MYFNDAKFEQGQEQLDAVKLKNVLVRALKYLRSDDKEWSASQKQIILLLRSVFFKISVRSSVRRG